MSHDIHDEALWRKAKKRAFFKRKPLGYVIINILLTATWYFTSGPHSYFWPLWAMFWLGIGVLYQYFTEYRKNNISTPEYEQLKKQL